MAALLVGDGAPAAFAACANNINATFDNPAAQTTPCVAVTNTSFTGNITNEGTVSPGGITFTNGTITGFINSKGDINGGIVLDANSVITSSAPSAINIGGNVGGNTFTGGVINSGSINATAFSGAGVVVTGPSIFTGGIVNNAGGFISGGSFGVLVLAASNFSGGIINAGFISGGVAGVGVGSPGGITVSNFSGGIVNSPGGIISGFSYGVAVNGVSTFSGGIANSGVIAGATGISVQNVSLFSGNIVNTTSGSIFGAVGIEICGCVSTFAGSVVNAGLISASSAGILVNGVSTFTGGILNTGTIAVGSGFGFSSIGIGVNNVSTFAGGIVNIGNISVQPFTGTAVGIGVSGVSNFSGGIVNAGSILVGATSGAFGIAVNGVSTFTGGIVNSGTISAGIRGTVIGIAVNGVSTFSGGIFNIGTISIRHFGTGSAIGIGVKDVLAFSGGISNSGTISVSTGKAFTSTAIGIGVSGVSNFSGGISNGGIVSVSANALSSVVGTGIGVSAVSTFSGGITNNGTISVSGSGGSSGNVLSIGIGVSGVATFAGGISNNGTISVGGSGGSSSNVVSIGIGVSGVATFAGGISNSGTISVVSSGSSGNTVSVGIGFNGGVSTFAGGISNSGTISVASFGSFGSGDTVSIGIRVNGVSTFSGGITNSGTISVSGSGGGSKGKGGGSTTIGIQVNDVLAFSGGISNSGTISVSGSGGGKAKGGGSGGTGVSVSNISLFDGGIANSGSITAGKVGVKVDSFSTFTGGISNSGTIATIGFGNSVGGIVVGAGSIFTGGITNLGTITVFTGFSSAGIRIGGTLFGGGSITSFAGGITNSGTVSVGGSGIGIWVNGVSAFSGGILNSGAVAAELNAISVQNVSLFEGGITNAASGRIVSDVGYGIEICSCVTTFNGGITNAGTISGGFGGIFASGVQVFGDPVLKGGIVNSGAIRTSNATGVGIGVYNIATFNGDISNSGTISAGIGIQMAGGSVLNGRIVNSGNITGTLAAIDVSNATVAVPIDQNGGVITGDIKLSQNGDTLNVNGGQLLGSIVGQNSTGTVNFATGWGGNPAFSIRDIAALNVNAGMVVLDNSFNGAITTTVNGGTLQVGDAASTFAALSSTTVDVVGGILSGHGTVNADVSVEPGGTLMPGGSIGTLTINGNLVFNNGSYLVELNPAAHSFTQVNGSATFNGGIVLLKPTLGFYGAQTYSIMNTTGGLSATPNPPPLGFANSASINGVTLSTTPNDLILTFAASSASTLVTPAGSTTNQQNVANALNTFIIGGGTPPPGFQNLANLGGPALQGALDQLSGQAGGFFAQSAFTAGTQFFNTIFNPNIPGHSGGQLPYAPQSSSVVSRARDAFASLGYAAPPFGDRRYSVWGTAYGGAGSVNGDPVVGSVNASASVAGFAAGIDTRIARDTTVGMALAGGGTSWSLAQGLGSGSSSMFQAAVYGTHWWGPAYISGALAYAYHDVTTKRTVTVAGIDLLQGRFQANGVAARLEGGYRLAMNTFGITPYGAVQAQWIHIPGYTEVATSGLPQFALNYQSQNPSTTRTELGARFDHRYVVNRDADLTLYSRIAWAHDFNDNSSRASAFFQALPGSNFIVNAAKPFTDSALVTAGANYALASGWSLQLKFDGEFSDNTSIYAGSGTLRKVW